MNRLSEELSPYLKAHANNPVDWFPWCKEAFEKAKNEDKAIFLSIGYHSCHWCHVMEIESFQNQEIAKILSENFVSIKVDKEERPDIDRHFQALFRVMNGSSGGWPLSIFMTPEKIPFLARSYIPAEDSFGMISFDKILKSISQKYKRERETLIQNGQEALKATAPELKIKATRVTKDLIKIASSQIESSFDWQNGGFGKAPKFPRASTLLLALELHSQTKNQKLLEIVELSVKKMSMGGFADLVDGGYCRYSTNDDWSLPHFEKMLYDNALFIELLTRLYTQTSNEKYLTLAKNTANFLLSKLSKDGLFFTASDADSNGVEGEYFLFGYDEVVEAFENGGLKNPAQTAQRLNITKEGNLRGKNILRLSSWEDFGTPEIEEALEILRSLRAKKEYPNIDEKILTSWSAMAIKSLFELARVDESYLEIAKKSLEKLRDFMSKGDRLYHSGVVGNAPNIEGFLEDYANLALAMVEAYKTTQERHYLKFAQDLVNGAIKRFYRGGKWSVGDEEFRDFAEDLDRSYPSDIGVVADAIFGLATLESGVYEKFLISTLQAHSFDLMRQPISRAKLTEVAVRYLDGEKKI